MRITCDNCRTTYDRPAVVEGRSACPFCEHMNQSGLHQSPSKRVQARANGATAKADVGTSTLVFPVEAQAKADPETTIRRATSGKTPSLPGARPFELVVVEGDEAGKRFLIAKPQIIIGRSVKADLQLKDSEVSREHCLIESYGETLLLKDLKSANGTVLNGFLIRQDVLKARDRIHIGNTTLEVARMESGAAKPTNGAGKS